MRALEKEKPQETASFRAIRMVVLVLLCAQNCALMMVTSYSRSLPGPQYLASTAVLGGELLKTCFIFAVLMYEHGPCDAWSVLVSEVSVFGNQIIKFAVPSFFYTIQGNLWFYGMSNMDSVTAAVTSQLKVPSTAIFSVIILGKKLTIVRWIAIGMLVMGLTIMQVKLDNGGPGRLGDIGSTEGKAVAGLATRRAGPAYYSGMAAMILSCTSSGFAGVYSEHLLKSMDINILTFNMQLQLFSVPVALLTVFADIYSGSASLWHGSLLIGWDALTCLVVFLNALGGIMVTLTMKYADNILKTFAVSMSLVINCLFSWWFMHATKMGLQDVLGVVTVITGTWFYNCGNLAPASAGQGGVAAHVVPKDLEESGVVEVELYGVALEEAADESPGGRRANAHPVAGVRRASDAWDGGSEPSTPSHRPSRDPALAIERQVTPGPASSKERSRAGGGHAPTLSDDDFTSDEWANLLEA